MTGLVGVEQACRAFGRPQWVWVLPCQGLARGGRNEGFPSSICRLMMICAVIGTQEAEK